MPVTVACPSCGVKLNVPDNFLGKKVRCASCSTVFEAKATAPAPAADEVEAAPAEEYIKPQAPAPLPEAPLDEPDERDDYDDRDGREDRESRRRRRRRRDMEPHRGGLVLGLGITSAALGLFGGSGVCCCIIFDVLAVGGLATGIAAWLMGMGDLRKMDQGLLDPDGRGSTQAGYICGIIGTALSGLDLLCSVIALALSLIWNLSLAGQRGF